MTIADRIARAQQDADQAAADYANADRDDPDKDYLGRVWSRAVDDLKRLKASAVPAGPCTVAWHAHPDGQYGDTCRYDQPA